VIRVLIADDHAIVRRGLKQIVSDASDLQVVAEADDYPEIMRQLRERAVDVLVLDIGLPTKNGLEVLKIVRKELPRLQVLMLTTYPESQYALRAMRAGAAGYLTKDSAPDRLVEAIRRLGEGRKYITPEIAEALALHMDQDTSRLPHERLSDREFETLRLIASGKMLSEIAEEMRLSPKTVSVYRARLLEKMELKNNAEMTHYALKHRLTE
jgi:two-component system, NarL family, invasion response regulator UvrY